MQLQKKSLATNIVSSPSAIFVSMIHDWLNEIKWSTSIGDIYYAIFVGSNLSTRSGKVHIEMKLQDTHQVVPRVRH